MSVKTLFFFCFALVILLHITRIFIVFYLNFSHRMRLTNQIAQSYIVDPINNFQTDAIREVNFAAEQLEPARDDEFNYAVTCNLSYAHLNQWTKPVR